MTPHITSLVSWRARLWDKRVRLTPCRKPAKTASTRAQSGDAVGRTQANTQKKSPLQLSNETFSRRMHACARCCRPCERYQMGDDGGIACLHALCGILVRGCKTNHLRRRIAKTPSATSQVQARPCSYVGHTRRESAGESALQHRVRDLAQTEVMWAHAIHVRNDRLVSVESGKCARRLLPAASKPAERLSAQLRQGVNSRNKHTWSESFELTSLAPSLCSAACTCAA